MRLNFANLPRGRWALNIGANIWFRIVGKEICFHKIGPIKMSKIIGYNISTIFLICMTKTGTADLMKCASKIMNKSHAIYITQTSIGLGQNYLR